MTASAISATRRPDGALNRLIRIGLVVLAIVCVWPGCSHSDNVIGTGAAVIPGSGVVDDEIRAVFGIDGVVLAGEGFLQISVGPAEELRISAEDNLMQYLRTEVAGGVLRIDTVPGVVVAPSVPIVYELTVTSLDSLVLSGAGEIGWSDVNASTLDVLISGVGGVIVSGSGSVDTMTVTLSGVGNFDGSGLATVEAIVDLSGVGTMTVQVSDRLEATLSGTGEILYIGDPIVDSSVTGSGAVRQTRKK